MIDNFGVNEHGRDFVVGDLHGCYSLLMQALDDVNFDPATDRVLSVGDLIDRGDESQRCLSLLDESWFMAVKGNHEDMFTKVLDSEQHMAHFLNNGGQWLLNVNTDGFADFAGWFSHWTKKVDSLPVVAEVGLKSGVKIGLLHAECLSSRWDKICSLDGGLLWGRLRFRHQLDTPVLGIDHIFCGHTITRQPVALGNTTYLDTGAYKNGALTLADLSCFRADAPRACIRSFSLR